MNAKQQAPIPVNVIAGPLGAGKTTMIQHLLNHRPAGERWAVLVNEYGLVGLDAALLDQGEEGDGHGVGGIEIREVAGGCICCSAGLLFEVALVRLLRARPDRLLIEPTGLAALSGILDTLDQEGFREAVDIRTTLCLVHPAKLSEDLQREEFQDQVEAADVLLANRCDLATPEQLVEFERWSQGLFPAKRLLAQVEYGKVEPELLDLIVQRAGSVARLGHGHGTDHHHDGHDHGGHDHVHSEGSSGKQLDGDASTEPDEDSPLLRHVHESSQASTYGWILWSGLIFEELRASAWLSSLASLPGATRVKAVLRTSEGWMAFNVAEGIKEIRPSRYRRDSRIELVMTGDQRPHPEGLEEELRRCLVSTGSP